MIGGTYFALSHCILTCSASLQTYGANVDQIKAQIGAAVRQEEVERALRSKKYKILTLTHVDTSTGVLSDAKTIAETVKKVSPNTLVRWQLTFYS
jgi:alanine-glyoxylate transaminase/serine-glyoxylate transaminase/serine-pyruvate transaminase